MWPTNRQTTKSTLSKMTMYELTSIVNVIKGKTINTKEESQNYDE